jgi:hypothetical protein
MPSSADIQGLLSGVAKTLSATLTAQATGQIIAASVGPPPGDLEVIDTVNAAFDLTWITKDVGFKDALPESSLDRGILTDKIKGGIVPISLPSSVQGLIGQLKGSIPLLNKLKVPVSLSVTWEVLNEKKEVLDASEFAVLSGEPGDKSTVKGLNVLIAFKPEVVEISKSAPLPVKTRYLQPVITLTALNMVAKDEKGDLASPSYSTPLPAIPMTIPAIGIPRLLAAFRHTEFRSKSGDEPGFVLLFAPADSPLQSVTHLKETLSTVQQTVAAVKAFPGLAAILPGIDTLLQAVAASPYFVFVAANEIPDLNSITAIERVWYENNIELEEEISSMILIGQPSKILDVWCETDFNNENGQFTLEVGPSSFTIVPNLHSDDPNEYPERMLTVIVKPKDDVGSEDSITFGDWISSLRWL